MTSPLLSWKELQPPLVILQLTHLVIALLSVMYLTQTVFGDYFFVSLSSYFYYTHLSVLSVIRQGPREK